MESGGGAVVEEISEMEVDTVAGTDPKSASSSEKERSTEPHANSEQNMETSEGQLLEDVEEGKREEEVKEKSTTDEPDPDSDADKPVIFVRNFADITEQDVSDDEDGGFQELITLDSEGTDSAHEDDEISTLKVKRQRKHVDKPTVGRRKLLDIATYDDSMLVDFEMSVEQESIYYHPKLAQARTKLANYLRRKIASVKKTMNADAASQKTTVPPPPIIQPPRYSRGPRGSVNNSRRGRSPATLNTTPVPQQSYPLLNQLLDQPPAPASQEGLSPFLVGSPFTIQSPLTVQGAAFWQPLDVGSRQVRNTPSDIQIQAVGTNPARFILAPVTDRLYPYTHQGHQIFPQPQQNFGSLIPNTYRNNTSVITNVPRITAGHFQQVNPIAPPGPQIIAPTASQLHLSMQRGHGSGLRPVGVTFPTSTGPTCTPMRPPLPPRAPVIPAPSQRPVLATKSTGSTPKPSGSHIVTAGNQKPLPSTLAESEKDLEKKTFPSLVVQVKPCLSVKPGRASQKTARSELDTRVKKVLINIPTKFTEWLMQRGLLKLVHTCSQHKPGVFKLGMYSDVSKQPFSGGYVWKADCCPDKPISVFQGSIFEGSQYPPGTVLKLLYHWSCQTPTVNVLQWVKVSNMYLKNFYTVLRAVCTTWIHERCPVMGGQGKCVEVGVITLGSSAETNRGVKNVNVEILGVLDPATKIIRMKVINGMLSHLCKDKRKGRPVNETEQGSRAFQILWPLTTWVDKRSVIVIDGIMDRALLEEVGFKNVHLCNEAGGGVLTNSNVLNYLRNVVPHIFSTTLSVLSKSIVQQFLDELSWREMYGSTVLTCYENLLDHIGEITKWDFRDETLIARLNRTAQNPFMDWSWSYVQRMQRTPLNTLPLSLHSQPGLRECIQHVMENEKKNIPPPPPVYTPSVFPTKKTIPTDKARVTTSTSSKTKSYQAAQSGTSQQKRKGQSLDEPICSPIVKMDYYKNVFETCAKTFCLQTYYYGSVKGEEKQKPSALRQRFPESLKCPLCTRAFTCNAEICRHLFTHIGSAAVYSGISEKHMCRICLKDLPSGMTLQEHVDTVHQMVGLTTACRICEYKFKTEQDLVIHMWDLHQHREIPYRCNLCSFATSFRYSAIQHHKEKHGGEAHVMCPFCLQILACATFAQTKQLISHLQAHSHQHRRSKKCPRCVLTFISDSDLLAHLQLRHGSQEPSQQWIPYFTSPTEKKVLMALPPPSKTPLQTSIAAVSASLQGPPAKKQKKCQPAPASKKKHHVLNASLAIPVDTNAKYMGTMYKIVIPVGSQGLCGECGQDINMPNHFVGRLLCTKCRYSTACQTAMNKHSEINHSKPGSKVKPGMKTKPVKMLSDAMKCKCGFSSTHPNMLANHLIQCEKMTAYSTTLPVVESSPSTSQDEQKSPMRLPASPTKEKDSPPLVSTLSLERSLNESEEDVRMDQLSSTSSTSVESIESTPVESE